MKHIKLLASHRVSLKLIPWLGFAALLGSGLTFADDTKDVLPAAGNAAICYRVTCYANQGGPEAAMYQFTIKGNTPNRPFNVQMTASKGADSKSVIDRRNGPGNPPPSVSLVSGPGIYDVRVGKTLREGETSLQGTMSYSITGHCLAANLAHTGEQIQKLASCGGPPPEKFKSFSASLPKDATQKSWKLECAPTKKDVQTGYYKFQIKFGNKNLPFDLALKVRKEGFDEQEVVATETKQPSDWGVLEGGDGAYYLDIVKQAIDGGTTDGKVAFSVKHNCFSVDGAATVLKKPKKLP